MSKPGSGCTLEAEWRPGTHRVGSEGGDGQLAVQGNAVQSLKWEAPLRPSPHRDGGSAGVGVGLSEEPGC